MERIYNIKTLKNNKLHDSTIIYKDKNSIVELIYHFENIKIITEDTFPFFALMKLRVKLEELNLFILCNGSRKDVYPSGNTASGTLAYVMKKGKPAKELVNIFEPVENAKHVANVIEQKSYRDNWLENFQ